MLARPLCFCLLACAQAAMAAAPVGDSAPLLEEIVVSASRIAQNSSVGVNRVLPTQSSDTLPLLSADLLRATPGVFVQQTTPGQSVPIVRGLKGSQVLHLVDGFRLNNAFFRSAPNQYLALVPTEAVHTVAVARGPVGTLYGSDAMGGVVALETAVPEFSRPLAGGGRVGWLSHSDALTGAAMLAGGSRDHAFRLGLAAADVDDRRVGSGERIAPSAYESRSAWLRTRHRWGEGEWGLNAQFAEQPSTPRVDELVPGFGQSEPAASEFYFEPNRRDFLQLSIEPAVAGPWGDTLSVQVGWQRIVDDRRFREFASPLRILEKNSSELAGLSVTVGRNFSSSQRLRYGLDLSRDTVRSARSELDLETGEAQRVASRFPDDSQLDSLGVFADYQWQASSRSTVELGVRYSRFDVEIAATEFGTEAASVKPDDISARVGLRYRLSDRVDLVGNIAQGFRAPNVFDLGALGARPGNRFNVANTDLEPEHILSYDLGLIGDIGALHWESTLFWSDYDDKITSVLTGELTGDGRLVVTSDNVAKARLYGAELSMNWLGPSGLALDGTLNWTWGSEEEAGQTAPADRIPPVNGRVRLSLPLGAWNIETVAVFAAQQERLSPRDLRDSRIDPEGTSGWLALNLRATRQLAGRLMLTVGVDNMLDSAYREHGSGIDAPGRGVVVELAMPLGGA